MAYNILLNFMNYPVDKTFEIHSLSEEVSETQEAKISVGGCEDRHVHLLTAVGPHALSASHLLSG